MNLLNFAKWESVLVSYIIAVSEQNASNIYYRSFLFKLMCLK